MSLAQEVGLHTRQLHQKKMMTDLPQIQAVEGACEACLQGKQHKRPFPSGTSWRAKAVLELIHTDVCGPMRTPSHEQNRYFILFIDDYSRMTWNGVSERKNRTVMEMARSMLQEKHLPKAFWAEAVYTAVYLLNRCPTKAVQNMTPIEVERKETFSQTS
ncbi:UNVERIFIED_CONTAM: hypothetical protein Sradi_6894800 [Sesamum radiatum]|uniref:Uncharacterized protein n=1 Tax=Sesamum radiatum TaxID=300843 RepID=A0AAW2JHR0_SESRA